jgi:hypothetical protein
MPVDPRKPPGLNNANGNSARAASFCPGTTAVSGTVAYHPNRDCLRHDLKGVVHSRCIRYLGSTLSSSYAACACALITLTSSHSWWPLSDLLAPQ